MLKPFWTKKKKLSVTADELDEAVEKAAALPDITAADAGKVLTVDSDGKWTLATIE